MSSISVVVPVFHNAGSLRDLATRLRTAAEACGPLRFEFVFVDDGSKDESLDVLRDLSAEDPRIRVVRLSRNFGSNNAILAGLTASQADASLVIAADLQDPPELIPDMVRLWREGHKVVLAVRQSRRDPLLTRALAALFYRLFRRFAIKTMPEHGFDFFLLDRRVRDLIVEIQENNAYLMGLILWMGFHPAVVPYDRGDRHKRFGVSMWTFWKRVKYFVDGFVAFSYVPLRLASLVGLVLAALAVAYGVLILYLRIARGFPVVGWTSLMLVLLAVSAVQILLLGVLGEYLWRNLEETRRRPRFVVQSVVEGGLERAPGVPPSL